MENIGLIIQILTIAVTVGVFVGTSKTNTKCMKDFFNSKFLHVDNKIENLKEDIGRLERKQDKYNHIQERLTIAEQRGKSNTHRIDGLEKIIR